MTDEEREIIHTARETVERTKNVTVRERDYEQEAQDYARRTREAREPERRDEPTILYKAHVSGNTNTTSDTSAEWNAWADDRIDAMLEKRGVFKFADGVGEFIEKIDKEMIQTEEDLKRLNSKIE